jgi:hypothetical protein
MNQNVDPDRLLRSHFGSALPSVAASAAANWRDRGATWIDHYAELRRDDLPRDQRRALAEDLDYAAREYLREDEPPDEIGEAPDFDPGLF